MSNIDKHFNDPAYKKINWPLVHKTKSDEWVKFYNMMVKLSKQLEGLNMPIRVKVKRKKEKKCIKLVFDRRSEQNAR